MDAVRRPNCARRTVGKLALQAGDVILLGRKLQARIGCVCIPHHCTRVMRVSYPRVCVTLTTTLGQLRY